LSGQVEHALAPLRAFYAVVRGSNWEDRRRALLYGRQIRSGPS
jgi:hypothetical protein